MIKSNSFAIIVFIAGILFTAGFACNQGDSGSTTNTASPSNSTTTSSTPAKTSGGDIAGSYNATGTNEDGGGNYKADLVVTPHDSVYQFSWASGGKTYDGVGVRTDDAVGVAFTEGSNGKGCGVVVYKIGADGSLDGKTGYWGVDTAESEKATRTSGTDLEGKYDITGKNPDGKDYKGTLSVKKDGEGYSFNWDAGGATSGFGIRNGDKAIVGFGGKQCAFVSYEVKPDGTLDGKWGGQNSKKFGTEVAKKK